MLKMDDVGSNTENKFVIIFSFFIFVGMLEKN
jgi:hypothetical protein